MNKGLAFLREKYGAAKGDITLKDGHCFVGSTPLIPGRMERKIVAPFLSVRSIRVSVR